MAKILVTNPVSIVRAMRLARMVFVALLVLDCLHLASYRTPYVRLEGF